MIGDIVHVSERLAEGDLQVKTQAEYKGDFSRIQQALGAAGIQPLDIERDDQTRRLRTTRDANALRLS